MIINNYVTGLCIHYTIFFIIILEYILSIYKKTVYCKTVCCVTPEAASCNLCLPHLLIVSFSFMLDLIHVVLFIMDLKCTKSTAKANVASNKPCRVTDLEMKLKVIKDQESANQWWLLLKSQVCPIPPPQLRSWRTKTKWRNHLKDLLRWKQRD